ncbi:MAG: hypothetical protein KDA81_01230 [Planctomycetaceae bacterium]|nr:hypothetical protein [Planctomycetaceae bacterium]
MRSGFWVFLLIFSGLLNTGMCQAALPPEVKKELSDLTRELRTVTGLIRKKQIDEARAVIQKIEDRVEELAIPEEDQRDRSYVALMTTLIRSKDGIPVSFEKEIAPLLKEKCIRCHGVEQVCANLRLDTYANMGRGGRSGPVLIPRNPQRSLLLAKVMNENPQQRMPQGGERLSDDEIRLLANWIAGGAEFDGEDVTSPIGDSMVEKKPPVKVVMADGTETVSFKDDVAPWLVGVCMGCHSGNNPRGGYSMETFEKLLSGGPTGNTIVPGDPDSSYMVDLVLRQEPLKMPAGNQTFLKKSQALALEKWIQEGAHFDGKDAKASIRSMVPTPEEREAALLASMSDQEFAERRKQQAATLWKSVAPRESFESVTSTNLYVLGNADESRLAQISSWGEAQVSSLTAKYKLPDGDQPWRGRLIVCVTKDRFDYEEFNTVLMNRRTPPGVSGHVSINQNLETAYVALHDVGDTENADRLTTQQLLNSLLAQAFLLRRGAAMPDWFRSGFGLLESGLGTDSAFMKTIPQRAAEAVSTITDPGTLFRDGTLSPDEVGPVGMLMTRFLINHGGTARLQQLAMEIQNGTPAQNALEKVYSENAANLGRAFIQSGGR